MAAELHDLNIPVKGIYFDQIAAGTKSHEFRSQDERWTNRLEGWTYRYVVMTRAIRRMAASRA